jgi:AcrR family transcriptional regulator
MYAKLRPGPNGPGPEVVARHQRARLYHATVELVLARGYATTSIKEICALAGVSRRTFYDIFGSGELAPKEACFLAAYDHVVGRAADRVWVAYRGEPDPHRRLQRAFEQALEALVGVAVARPGDATGVGLHGRVVALMRHLAADPCLVQVAFQEIFALGPSGVERRDRSLGRFTTFLTLSKSTAPPAGVVVEATVGAIWGIVDYYAARGAARRLPTVAGHATYMALAPVLGAHAAVEIIRGADSDG